MVKNEVTRYLKITKERDLATLDFYFTFEPDFVFSYTPDALRAVCTDSNQVARLLILRMKEMLASIPEGRAIERRGFVRHLSNREWLQKMIWLAKGEEAFNYDVDETCYVELNAARQAKLTANEQQRAKRRTCTIGKAPDATGKDNDKADDKQSQAKEGAEAEYFLQSFRSGQLHISNFIPRCGVLSVGARGKGRQEWKEDAPLIVRDVSGFKNGDIVISYVGKELRPADIVTWSKILYLAATSPLGTKVTISKAQLLKARGGGDGSNSSKAAKEEIERLQNASFKVTIRRQQTIDAIARGCADDESIQDAKKTGLLSLSFHLLGQTTTSGRLWTIHVEPVVRLLFGKGISSWYDERVYKSIRGDYAKRLYLLYYSHKECFPLTLAELRKYLGSTMAEDSDFQDAIDEAHDELEKKEVICRGWKLKESGRRYNALAYVVTRPCRETDEAENTENA